MMNTINFLAKSSLLIFILFFVTSCGVLDQLFKNNEPEPVKSYMFESEGCMSGCWKGIRPGETTTEEFVTTLLEDEWELTGEIKVRPYRGDDDSVLYLSNFDEFSLAIITRNNYVFSIELAAMYFDLTLSEVLQTLSIPPYIISIDSDDMDESDLSHRYAEGFVTLFYPELGYVFTFMTELNILDRNTVEVCISEDDYARSIDIYQPGTIREILRDELHGLTGFTSPEGINRYVERRLTEMTTWQGYGCKNFSLRRN